MSLIPFDSLPFDSLNIPFFYVLNLEWPSHEFGKTLLIIQIKSVQLGKKQASIYLFIQVI